MDLSIAKVNFILNLISKGIILKILLLFPSVPEIHVIIVSTDSPLYMLLCIISVF